MEPFKTIRAAELQETDLSPAEKVCLAASDYRHATAHETFAHAHGGVDLLRADLFTFVDMWSKTL
jgi:hypothetical protein